MLKKIPHAILTALAISSCTSIPETVIEPPCTRTQESFYDGKYFTIESGVGSSFSTYYYRYNKAMWGSYNKFVPKEAIEGKQATVMCYELVPGPGNINQRVVALKVDGILETIYANSMEVADLLGREKSAIERQEKIDAFKSIIGKKIWSKPQKFVRSDGLSKFILLTNLEELTVYDVAPIDGKESKSYLHVLLKRASHEIVYVSYDIKTGILRFNLDWHTSNPRNMYKNWSTEIWRQIEQNEVAVGMTSDMVRLAIGNPDDINTTETIYGLRSQWVYKSYTGDLSFYYFNNNVLEAIQY